MEFYRPTTVDEAVALLRRLPGAVKILAGGTDLAVEREFFHPHWDALVSIENIPALRGIREEDGALVLGAAASFADVMRSALVRRRAASLVEAARTVGSWAIQLQGTVGGNLATASPAGDGSAALLALGAEAILRGPAGERRVPLQAFFTGPKRSVLARDELITAVRIPPPPPGGRARGRFLKVGRRKAMAISIACAAVEMVLGPAGEVLDVGIALGSVAPTPLRARDAEAMLRGRRPDASLLRQGAAAAAAETRPIDDVRGDAWYRREVAAVLVERALRDCLSPLPLSPCPPPPAPGGGWQERGGGSGGVGPRRMGDAAGYPIAVTINGERRELRVPAGETFLSTLRTRLGLAGAKDGCREGECGACTILVDGQPVRSCLIFAPTMDGRTVTTIEGLGDRHRLDSLQEAFHEEWAVQCGFCIPGFILAARALLDANPRPTEAEIREALSGHLCRCTGYTKIIAAVRKAAQLEAARPAAR